MDPRRVWATVEAVPEDAGGVFLSEDAGASFRRVNDHMDVRRRPYYYAHIIADTQDLDTVYVLTKPILKSIDAGKTFESMSVPHGDGHDLRIAPDDNRRMILGDDGGAAVTFDGGRSWSDSLNQPTGQFYWAVTDDQFPYRIYGAQQDNTTVSIPSRTPGFGIDRTDWYPVGGGESGFIAPDPRDPDVVYAGSFWGLLTRYDHRTGESRNVTPWPDSPMGRTGVDVRYRFGWTYPILVSPHDPSTIYAAGNVVFRSNDQGQAWEVVSADLTRDDEEKENGDRLTDFYCTIASLAESKLARGVLWAGSDDGLVHLSRDGAATWENVTPPELPEWSRVNVVEPSPHDAGTAYVAANRYLWDDYRPYLFKTSDFGKTWKRLDRDFPQSSFVRVVREDVRRKGLLYVGTETGIHVSFDDGLEWQPLQLNLPVVPVTDLVVKDDDLVAATQGRAFWILDDLGLIRELPELTPSSPVHLFAPENPYRMRGFGRRRAAAGVGENPPTGAVLYYYLREKPSAAVELDVLDSTGAVVKKFRGPSLPAERGLNRFEWDLRYPDARGLPGRTYLMGGSLRGPVAVPGVYQARLSMGEHRSTQSFEIRKDPRIPTTDSEFREQFDLLLAIGERLSEVHEAIAAVLESSETARGARGSGEGPGGARGRRQPGERALEKTPDGSRTVLRAAIHRRRRSAASLSSQAERPAGLSRRRGRERRPGADRGGPRCLPGLSSELDDGLAELQGIVSSEIPELNRTAQEKGMGPISSMLRFAPDPRGSGR